LRRPAALCFAGAITILGIAVMAAATAAGAMEPAPARIEARSADLLAVGVVQDDRMSIHLSRLLDNAPVRDVAVTVLLRGVAHPTTAEADGGFTLQTPDLRLPGTAGVEIQVAAGGAAHETLKGALQVAAGAGQADDKNSARQLWWWVLNFAVCIGFLWLISRRRKSAQG